MKRVIAFFLAAAVLLGMIPMLEVETRAATSLPSSIYLTQEGKTTCTLCSAAMMLRARMYLSGNSSWSSVTERGIRSAAWIDGTGLRWVFTYKLGSSSITVSHKNTSGISASSLKSILDEHPEGISLYCGNIPHAVFVTDYEGDTFYCADPYSGYSGQRIPLASSYLGNKYGSQANILKKVTAYWYVSSYSITGGSEGTVEPCTCSTAYAGTYVCTTTGGATLNIRSGHGSSYGVIGSIPSGATVTVTKASGSGSSDWAHISYNGITGFASMGYLKKQEPKPEQTPADLGTGFYGVLLNTAHGKPIGGDADGFLRMQTENGSSSQVWRFDRQADGSYLITSAQNGYALQMQTADPAGGTPAAVLGGDTGSSNQRWFLYLQGSGYVLQSAQAFDTPAALTLEHNNPADGNPIVVDSRSNTGSQIWTIYRDEAVQLTGPVLSVETGNAEDPTAFTWTDVYGESGYTLKIWCGTDREGDPAYKITDAASGWSTQLPVGAYVAYVEAYNHYTSKMSNVVMFTITEHQHEYGPWETVREVTCTEDGQQQRGCQICDDVEIQILPASGHRYGVWAPFQEPTCTEPGQEKQICTRCGAFETQPIPPRGHDYTAVVTDPTCTEAGFTTHTCCHCGDQYVADYVDVTGHNYTAAVTAPTCTEDGYTTYICTVCGDSYIGDPVDATGHDFVDGKCHCGKTENINEWVGDVSGDGLVDTTDAKMIMQYDLGLVDAGSLDLSVADVNGDGAVDSTDAKLIMQLDLGILT